MGVQADRKEAELDDEDARDGDPDADAHAALVAQAVEAGDLARIDEQLQRSGKGDPE